jgi:hypothetical protein
MRPIIYFYLATICLLVPNIVGASDAGAMLSGTAAIDGAGSGSSSGSSDQPLIVTVRPNDYGQLVELPEFSEGANSVDGKGGFNALWVVDDSGEMNDDLSVPLNSYGRVFITPFQDGTVVVEHLYPDNHLQTSTMGAVKSFHTYGFWFSADTLGTHQLRYNVNGGEYSNVVEFYVS